VPKFCLNSISAPERSGDSEHKFYVIQKTSVAEWGGIKPHQFFAAEKKELK
jgi:hypothetical protein